MDPIKDKIEAIKMLRNITPYLSRNEESKALELRVIGLKEAKDLVESIMEFGVRDAKLQQNRQDAYVRRLENELRELKADIRTHVSRGRNRVNLLEANIGMMLSDLKSSNVDDNELLTSMMKSDG